MIIVPMMIIILLLVAFTDTTLFLYGMLVIFIFASTVLLLGKGSWYISGYNVLTSDEKKKYNDCELTRLCRLVGIIHLPFILLIASCIISNTALEILSLLLCVVVLVIVLAYIVKNYSEFN